MLFKYYMIETCQMLVFKCDIKQHYICNINKVIHIVVEVGLKRYFSVHYLLTWPIVMVDLFRYLD